MDKPAEIIKALTMEIERLKETQKYKSVNSVRTINQLYSTIETLKSDHARDLLAIEESHIIKIDMLTNENQSYQVRNRARDTRHEQQKQQLISDNLELQKKYTTSKLELTQNLQYMKTELTKLQHSFDTCNSDNDKLRSLNIDLNHQSRKARDHPNSGEKVLDNKNLGDEVYVKLKLMSRSHMSKISIKTKEVDKSRYSKLVKMNPELIEKQVTDLTEYLHMWPLFRKIGWLYETSIGLDITSTDWMALSS